MTALTAPRSTARRDGNQYVYPVRGGEIIHAGAMVQVDRATGLVGPGVADAVSQIVGVAEETADASLLGNAEIKVMVRRGVFLFANEPTDPVTLGDVRAWCYLVDDQTVSKNSALDTRQVAGFVEDVDAAGVWVRI